MSKKHNMTNTSSSPNKYMIMRTLDNFELFQRSSTKFFVAAKPVRLAVLLCVASAVMTPAIAQPISATNITSVSACNAVGTSFKTPEGDYVEALNSTNSSLPVAADKGLWSQSKGLPLGAKLLLTVSDVKAPADSRSVLRLNIQAYDAAGALITSPVKLLVETNLGRLSTGGYSQQHAALEVIASTGQVCMNLVAPSVAGESLIRVSSGAVKVQGKIDFLTDLRPMLIVGLIEGGISLTKFKKDELTPNIVTTNFDENLRNFEKTTEDGDTRKSIAGRVAVFVKGTVKGEYLLTAAFDSDKITKQKLFRDIDPEAFYPIYGDASIKSFDAQSNSRLYVRIDKEKSYLLYGDYTTASADEANKLASYSRSLTGAKAHYEDGSMKLNLWTAKDTLRAFVDEQAALGISGPYAVSQPNAVANSEKIELLVRDRNQNSVVIKRELLIRFVDYDFEPFTGKILFRKPIPSVDENLNPVSIRTTYEVDEGGEKFWVGGADIKFKAGVMALGASYATDKNSLSPYQLGGVNAEMKLGDKTYVVAEVAKSKGTQFYNQNIESLTQPSTGYSTNWGGIAPSHVVQAGQAARLEIRHSDDDLQARAYVSKVDANFQNSNAGMSAGREEAGATLTLKASKDLTIKATLSHTKDTATASKRDMASVGASYKMNDRILLDISLNQVNESGTVGSLSVAGVQNSQSAIQGLGWNSSNGYGLNGIDLLNPANEMSTTSAGAAINNEYTSLKARLTGKVTNDTSLYAEYERATDDTGRQRAALGTEYRINEKSRVYGRYEFENTLFGASSGINLEGRSTRTSVLGIDAEYMKDGQLFSEYRLSGAQNGLDASAAIGIRNQWAISEGLTVNTSAERQALRPIEGQKNDAVAMSFGVLYAANPIYKLGGKVEYRTTRATDHWNLTAAYDRKLSSNWSAIVRDLYIYSHDKWRTGLGDQKQNRLQIGTAYRDAQTNQFNGLARLEYRTDVSTAVADPKDTALAMFSLHGNYHPMRSTSISGQAAYKTVREKFGEIASKWQGALVSGRYSYDINDRFDVSVMASRTWGTGASVSGIGVEVGARIVDNMWFGLSYNKGKFVDTELFNSNASWTGWHARLKYKYE